MTEGGGEAPPPEPPPLGPADLYLYAYGNGAVFLLHPDGRSGFVTLHEATAMVTAGRDAGGRVFLGADHGDGLAPSTASALRQAGATIVDYQPPQRPYEWTDGSDAVMTAAAHRQDELLDDLIDRGADVHATNDTGATPLHHAAAAGNLHAINRLLAAGADPDARNDAGLTPLMAAQACREHHAAMHLEAAGATPTHAHRTDVRFRSSHVLPFLGWCWTALVFAFFGALTAAPLDSVLDGVPIIAGGLIGGCLAVPSWALWTGARPRQFDGRRLRLTTLVGRTVEIDLDDVTAAAYAPGGGALSGRLMGAKLALAHPGGRSYRQRSLERALRRAEEAEVVVNTPVTMVILDPSWEHEVLRPVGNRLISDPVTISPFLRGRLEAARSQDPSLDLMKQWRPRRKAQVRAELRSQLRRRK